MALQNPNTLYTAGSVVFEQPKNNLYANLLAKKQAREEALNQYFTELGDKINTAGVRMQDLSGPNGGITDEISAWRQNWLQNKEDIKRGGMAQQEHLAKLNQIHRKIAQSKQRGQIGLEMGKAKFEGKYDPDDDDLHVIENIDKSIYDPSSYKQDGVTEYGWQDLSPSVPEFDPKKQNEFWMTASRGLKPGKVYDEANMRVDKTTGKAFVPFKELYSGEQIKKIADDAADLVKGDRSARKYYNKILDSPKREDWERLNDAYQSVYGKNAQVATPEQAAQADMIIKASGVFDAGEQAITDQDSAFQRSLARMAYNSNLIASRALAKSGSDDDTKNIVDVYSRVEEATEAAPEKLQGWGKNKRSIKEVSLKSLDAKSQETILGIVNKLSGHSDADLNDPNKLRKAKYYQDDVYIMKENGINYIVDKKTKEKIVPLDPQGTNLPAQPSVKEKRMVIEQNQQSLYKKPAIRPGAKAAPTQKEEESYSMEELRGSWTQDQIKKAIAAGKLQIIGKNKWKIVK